MKKLSLVLALALCATPALATNGLRMTAFSPLNASVGGAGAAHAWDSSALVLNPATLSELGGRVDFGAAYFPTTVTYSATNSYIGSGIPALEAFGQVIVNQPNTQLTSSFPPVPIPNIGLVIPFGNDFRLGVGMAAVAGVGASYAANLFSSTVQSQYFNFRFPIGASYRFFDGMLSVGAAVNGSWALMGYSLGASIGLPPHPSSSSFGIGFTLGARVQPVKMFSIGASWESPTWFQPFEFEIGPSSPLGTGPFPGGQEKLAFDMPWNGTIGVEFAPFEDDFLVLVADLQYIAWSTTLGPGKPAFVGGTATVTSAAFPFSTSWSDQLVFKVGAQVKVVDWLKLRAGFNFGEAPVDANRALENIAFPAIAESHLTAGAGFQLTKAIALNLATVIGFKNTVTGSATLPDLSLIPGSPVPPGTPPAVLTSTTGVSGYTLEAGLSVTY